MQEAVQPVYLKTFAMHNPAPYIEQRVAACEPVMRADLAAANATNAPLPKPVKAR
jgi:hypothetical protein